MRICSLIPSGTEILFALGLGDQVIGGVTEYCNYPPEAKSKSIVSRGRIDASSLSSSQVSSKVAELMQSGAGTYLLDADWLRRERPDLILSQDLCQVCDLQAEEVVRTLDSLGIGAEVLVLSPLCLSDILNNIRVVGRATGRTSRADGLVSQLQVRMGGVVRNVAKVEARPRVLCLEWIEPPTAGGHWIPEMVPMAGGTDVLVEPGASALRVEWQQVLDYAPEVLFLIPCAMDITRTLQEMHGLARKGGWWEIPAVKAGKVYIVDSDFYSVPGPRVFMGLEIMAQLLHPQLFRDMMPAGTVLKLDAGVNFGCHADEIARQFHPYVG